MRTRTSAAAAGLGLAILGTIGPLMGAQPALASSSQGWMALSHSPVASAEILATDRAYQAFRSGERAAYGSVGLSPDELFRSGERAS